MFTSTVSSSGNIYGNIVNFHIKRSLLMEVKVLVIKKWFVMNLSSCVTIFPGMKETVQCHNSIKQIKSLADAVSFGFLFKSYHYDCLDTVFDKFPYEAQYC